ncbi:MAG: NUDIX domain-containing protein [Parcubacteria group bacterium]|nr:NUDIX domain-containing protein [Parcubacteria group bacterium]
MGKDYTNEKVAPVLIVFVRCGDKHLILKRGDKVLAYKNLWSSVAGFIDDDKDLEDKIVEELSEEIGVTKERIKSVKKGEVYTFQDKESDRDWVRHLYLVEVADEEVVLDWEHTDYVWISPNEIKDYETTPRLEEDLKKVMVLN